YKISFPSGDFSFIAVGTPEDSIVFTSVDNIWWRGIYFYDTQTKVEEKKGIINIAYCKFEKCSSEVLSFSPSSFNNILIQNSLFKGNKGTPISCLGVSSKKYFYNNVFIDNGMEDREGGGIFVLSIDKKEEITTFIENNIFLNNKALEGGAIFIQKENCVVKNNVFEKNKSEDNGGAVFIMSSKKINIENNTFLNNYCKEGGGAVYYTTAGPDVVLRNNRFEGNTAYFGGAIMTLATSFTLEGNIFVNNKVPIKENLDREYMGMGGAIALLEYSGIPIIIADNLFVGNIAPTGGALSLIWQEAYLINNTIYGNTSTFGGGIYWESSEGEIVKIYNTILWGNQNMSGNKNQCYFFETLPDFYYCIVEGGTSDFWMNNSKLDTLPYLGTFENCIDVDPKFVDPASGNFRLLAGSPAIDAGIPDTSGLYIPALDLDLKERIVNGRIDIGCYEYSLPATIITQFSESQPIFKLTPKKQRVVIDKSVLSSSYNINLLGRTISKSKPACGVYFRYSNPKFQTLHPTTSRERCYKGE
ncbi:MAG: right-handed parallel beta-helix repeat-containing protein, partial [Chitinispirillaceae bacterium]|nr:right-handed parallel beta-helix repeat-containing protein [Chitinispirillaceae bacterium]